MQCLFSGWPRCGRKAHDARQPFWAHTPSYTLAFRLLNLRASSHTRPQVGDCLMFERLFVCAVCLCARLCVCSRLCARLHVCTCVHLRPRPLNSTPWNLNPKALNPSETGSGALNRSGRGAMAGLRGPLCFASPLYLGSTRRVRNVQRNTLKLAWFSLF